VYVATVDIIPLMLQDTTISTIFVETLAMMLGLTLYPRSHPTLDAHPSNFRHADLTLYTFI